MTDAPMPIERAAPPPAEASIRNSLLSEYMALIGAQSPLDALAHVPAIANAQQVNDLIRQLDSPVWRTRDSASRALVNMGMLAAPLLAQALENNASRMSLEQTTRCRQAIDRIINQQTLHLLISHLNCDKLPGYLQTQIRNSVRSRVTTPGNFP